MLTPVTYYDGTDVVLVYLAGIFAGMVLSRILRGRRCGR